MKQGWVCESQREPLNNERICHRLKIERIILESDCRKNCCLLASDEPAHHAIADTEAYSAVLAAEHAIAEVVFAGTTQMDQKRQSRVQSGTARDFSMRLIQLHHQIRGRYRSR
jgi:hypothetical protein